MAAPVTEKAIAKLRELIIAGRLGPGSRLPPEHELAAQLGSSRSTAREAVRALVTARVLDVRRGDGTYVTSLRPELLLEGIGFAAELMQDDSALELIEVRRVLEPALTGMAAGRITPGELAELASLLDLMRAAGSDIELLVVHDAGFHATVAAASGNATLSSMLVGISGRLLRARVWRGIREEGAQQRTLLEHERIYAALDAGDIELARAVALIHVMTTESFVRRMLSA